MKGNWNHALLYLHIKKMIPQIHFRICNHIGLGSTFNTNKKEEDYFILKRKVEMYISVAAISLWRSSSEVYVSGFKFRNRLQVNTRETILKKKSTLPRTMVY